MAEPYQPAGGPVGEGTTAGPGGTPGTPASAARMLVSLQSALEPRAVLSLFAEELGHWLPVDRLRFEDARGRLLHGGPPRGLMHSAVYRLQDGDGELLGTLTAERRIRFTEAELGRLEEAILLLERPLRNAITHQKALRQARCDGLTGLYNRAALDDMLARELELAQRHDAELALVMFDLNRFRAVNDRRGHRAGDRFLVHVAEQLTHWARGSDLLFRHGGGAFVLLTRQTGVNGARCLAVRLVETLAAAPFRDGDVLLPVAVSVGIAERRGGEDAQALFERSERALHRAKRHPDAPVQEA